MIGQLGGVLRRLTPEPVLVRAALYLAGVTGLLVAAPAALLSGRGALVLVGLLAAIPVLAPGGRWVTVVALVAVAGWLVATSRYGEPVTAGRVLALGAALYLLHSLAALAAALPHDAVVAPGAVVRWLARVLAVVLGSALLSAAVLTALAGVGGRGGYLAATVAGLAVATGLAALLSWTARR